MRRKLTPAFCKTATAEEGQDRTYYWDESKPGFYLMVTTSGHRSFGIQYRLSRRRSPRMRIKATSLDAARKEATKLLGEVANGGDPLGERRKRATEAEGTFKRVAENFFKREGPRLRSIDQRRSVFERLIYPKFASWPINDIGRGDIAKLLDTIEDENGPVMADRTLAYLGRVFAWHAARDDKFRSPIVRGMSRTKAKERARSRILSDDELRAVWRTVEASKGPFGPLLRFILLTSARRNEAAHMARSEVTGSTWVLPAARNKVKIDLARPLSGKARALLAELPAIEGCNYFFVASGNGPIRGFADHKARFDRDCGVTGWTIHDLRRTARSLMSRAGVNADIAERCLGHVIPGVRGVYDRHEYEAEMAHAFEALAAQIERIVNLPVIGSPPSSDLPAPPHSSAVTDGGHMSKRACARQTLLPDDAYIAAQRQALPNFDPYDMRQLLADAEALAEAAGTAGKRMALDEAVIQAHRQQQVRQIDELTQAMGLDPRSTNFWRDAFMGLAKIEHNVGRLIHRLTPGKRNIKSQPNKSWKQRYVERVDVLRRSNGARETFRLLARSRLVRGEWRLQPEVENSEDVRAHTDRARADKFRQTYYRAKRANAPPVKSAKERTAKSKPELAPKPVGLLFMSNFETLLFNIENSLPK